MFSPQPASDSTAVQYTIQHDIEAIDDPDEFLEGDTEDYLHAMLGNAGCFY